MLKLIAVNCGHHDSDRLVDGHGDPNVDGRQVDDLHWRGGRITTLTGSVTTAALPSGVVIVTVA